MTDKRQKNLFLTWCAVAAGLALAGPANADRITKCKDENGKWHYGDYAAQACTQSKITKMNEQGVKVEEQEAALSREEARAIREAKARKLAADQKKAEKRSRDRRLLLTYETIESIEHARDERVEAVDRFLRSDQEFLKRLQDQLVSIHARLEQTPEHVQAKQELQVTEDQITAYEKSISTREEERQLIVDRFNADIERYKAIKSSLPTADNEEVLQ